MTSRDLRLRICLAATICAIAAGCSSQDSDYVPYSLKGMNAYVYNSETDRDQFAGFSEGSYLKRDELRAACYANASAEAKRLHWENWTYVCCTVTSDSNCKTKVR